MREYGFKPTTEGRELLAACLATGKGLEITRVAVGSGRVGEDVNLADMTDLIEYVAEGSIAERRHINNILHLTVQYESNSTPGLGAFYLSEFIVQAKHPVTEKTVTLLYATLGDYIQHVNAYSETAVPDVRQYPIALVLSDEVNVTINTPGGLVTYDDLEAAIDARMASVGSALIRDITIPAADWVAVTEDFGDYKYTIDVALAESKEDHFPDLAFAIPSLSIAGEAGVCKTIEALDGIVRLWAETIPTADLTGTILLRSESLVDTDLATDEEVDDTVDGVFGEGSSSVVPDGYTVATDEDVANMNAELFGTKNQ